MKDLLVAWVLVLGSMAAAGEHSHATWRRAGGYTMPDPLTTPGIAVSGMTKEKVCSVKWGRDVRHVTEAMKRQVCGFYGAATCPGPAWEIDHLVSRELGGADDLANLWPQPIQEARVKDRVENWLHKQVCAGRMTLPEAQRAVLGWPAYIDRSAIK